MRCLQCTNEHNGYETVCEGCVKDAMCLMEGALGGKPTAQQIYRMFDMGGCGRSPLEDFRPRCEKRVTSPCVGVGTRFKHLAVFPWEVDGSWFNHVFETVCEVTELQAGKVIYRLLCVTVERNRPPRNANKCPTLGSCPVEIVERQSIYNEVG